MKSKSLFLLLLLVSALASNAQQKIRVSSNIVTMMAIPVNPRDTLFQKAFVNSGYKNPFPFFKAMPDAKFYSEKELDTLKLNIEKVNRPDTYFLSVDEYNLFIANWIKELNERRTATEKSNVNFENQK